MLRKPIVAVFGGGKPAADVRDAAKFLGYATAVRGAVLLTGGLPALGESVKNVAMRGATCAAEDSKVLARLIGVLTSKDEGKSFQNIQCRYQRLIETELTNYQRNPINGFTPDAVVVLEGEAGTLAELGFALAAERSCYFVGSTEPLREFLGKGRAKVKAAIQTGLNQYRKFDERTLTVEGIAKSLDKYFDCKTDDLSFPVDLSGAEILVNKIVQEIDDRGLRSRRSGFPGVPGVLSKQSFEDWLSAMP